MWAQLTGGWGKDTLDGAHSPVIGNNPAYPAGALLVANATAYFQFIMISLFSHLSLAPCDSGSDCYMAATTGRSL